MNQPIASPLLTFPSMPGDLRAYIRAVAIALLLWCGATVVLQSGSATLETIFFKRDVLWMCATVLVLLLIGRATFNGAFAVPYRLTPARVNGIVLAIAALVVLTALLGAHVVCHDDVLSADEAAVRFDSAIFRQGRVIAPIPAEWRPYADALGPQFILPVGGHAAWVSAYLPVNAALHALSEAVVGLDCASAILAGIAILAVAGVARRLWPDRPDAAIVAALCLATSTQFLITSFTLYAMTAHLALNLVWLWLYLRGGRSGNAGAIAVAFLATGLHQLVFHALFAAPFMVRLWTGRRWRKAMAYTVCYALIGVFWVLYWQIILGHYQLHGAGPGEPGIMPFLARVADLVRAFGWFGCDLMAKNITRFLAWQNPFTLVLVAAALTAAGPRPSGTIVALAAGIVLTVVAMFVLLPYQGHGWGYRYLHGLLGSVSLLAAYGWVKLTRSTTAADASSHTGRFALAAFFSIAVMLPGRAIEAEKFTAPVVAAQALINNVKTELVIVDPNGTAFATDLVRNDPYLRRRPLVMDLAFLSSAQIASLCASHTVSLFDRFDGKALAMLPGELGPDTPARQTMRRLQCGRSLR